MSRTTTPEPTPFAWLFTGWQGIAVGLFAAIVIAVTAVSAIDSLRLIGAFGAMGLGDRGFETEALSNQVGVERIAAVAPGSVAAQAGLRPGDLVHYDQSFEATSLLTAGRSIGLTVVQSPTGPQGQVPRHVTIMTAPTRFADAATEVQVNRFTAVFQLWFGLILGAFVLVRGWGRLSSLAFGLGMIGLAMVIIVPSWAHEPSVAAAFLYACAVVNYGVSGIFLFPAMLYAERVGRPTRQWMPIFALIGVSCVAVFTVAAWGVLHDASYPLIFNSRTGAPLLLFLFDVQALYWSWRGKCDALGADRGRFATVFFAFGFNMIYSVLEILGSLAFGDQSMVIGPVAATMLNLLANLVSPVLLAYAALRSRVIDLDFALNRTAIFGTVSVILLSAFGLIEWGVEHLLPEDWVKASAWIDAGVAVMVYLAFHRVHDAVEHRVEHLFFHHWQAKEDSLRQFVTVASHFEDPGALARAFADELSRFGGEARVALYRRNEGVLDQVAGTWDGAPQHFREDDRAFATMRATRRPLDLTEAATSLPGALALPMIDHGTLAGLVLMDLKDRNALYRPDEIALLGWAAHDVGLVLDALHARATDAEIQSLKMQVSELGAVNAELRGRVDGWLAKANA